MNVLVKAQEVSFRTHILSNGLKEHTIFSTWDSINNVVFVKKKNNIPTIL